MSLCCLLWNRQVPFLSRRADALSLIRVLHHRSDFFQKLVNALCKKGFQMCDNTSRLFRALSCGLRVYQVCR